MKTKEGSYLVLKNREVAALTGGTKMLTEYLGDNSSAIIRSCLSIGTLVWDKDTVAKYDGGSCNS